MTTADEQNQNRNQNQKPWLNSYPDWLPESLPLEETSILDLFENALKSDPDAPCIHYFQTTISFREAYRMALSLAASIQELGLRQQDRVILVMQNIPQAAIAPLAIWMCGATVVPINPMYTSEEQSRLIADCGASLIICQDDLFQATAPAATMAENLRAIITTSPLDLLDPLQEIPGQLRSSTRLHCEGALDLVILLNRNDTERFNLIRPKRQDLAYLVYTSGTTGPPKGAMLTHANIVYNTHVYEKAIRLDRNDVVLGVAPMFHITGIVAHLAVSFRLAIPFVLFHRFEAADVLQLIETHRITFTVAAITVYTALLNHPELKQHNISTFRKAYSGGAPVSPSTVENFQRTLGLTLHNVYGLTESASPVTITPLGEKGPVDEASGALSVGLVIPGVDAWIVNENNPDEILPPGEAGELVLKGPCMIDGYWKKPEETNHVIKEGRFFTGDIAKIDENGWCYIVDRKKDLINVSGFKVWPRDVEDVLYQHPSVKEAAVVGIPDEYRGETVKAYVSLNDNFKGKTTPAELIAFCKEKMAAFKYPRQLDIIDEIPKTLTGKFLRRQLRELG